MEAVRRARKARLGPAVDAWAAIALLAALLVPSVARAEQCPAPTAALAAIPAGQRLSFVTGRLEAERGRARAWSWTWGVTNAALTAGQLGAIPFTSGRDGRILLGVGAGLSAAAVAQIVLAPITVGDPLASRPPGAPAGQCAALATAERTFERAARNEALGSGVAAQVGNLVVNALFAIAVGATDRWTSGALAFGTGWVLGEAQILSEPRALVGDLDRYRAGQLLATAEAPRARTGPFAVRGGGGLTVAVAF